MAKKSKSGWAMVEGDELHGVIFIYVGDESGFVATRAKERKARRRK